MKWFFSLAIICFSFFSVSAQVNPQNGAAQFTLPLYSYTDAGNRLQLSVSLDYKDGNGLKVSEMAPAVGTGWGLSCGGVIERIQHGEPDDQRMDSPPAWNNGPINGLYILNYYPNGYLFNASQYNAGGVAYSPSDDIDDGGAYSPFQSLLTSAALSNYKLPPQYLADRDQDIFAFSFDGRSGEFVIGKDFKPRTLIDSKLQISIDTVDNTSNNIRTLITQFTITDENGIQYVFKDEELNAVCAYTSLSTLVKDNENVDNFPIPDLPLGAASRVKNDGTAVNVVQGVPDGSSVVDKWYLSKIINPFTGKQITFNYTTYNEDKFTDITATESTSNGFHSLGTAMAYWHRYKVTSKRISSVVLSPVERLDFVYSSVPRIDLPNQNTLNKIQVSYNGSPIYSWQFGYGYMVGMDKAIKNPGDTYSPAEKDWSRLCLLTAQRFGLNGFNEPPYTFSYNLEGNEGVVPPMFSVYQDAYGYYNNFNSITNPASEFFHDAFYKIQTFNSLVQNQNNFTKQIMPGMAANGILQSVTYPYGGTLSFTYGPNVGAIDFGGVRVNQTTQYDGVSHSNDIIKNYAYVLSDEGTTSGWGGENFTYSTVQTATSTDPCSVAQTPSAIFKEVTTAYLERAFLEHFAEQATTELAGAELCDVLGQFELAFVFEAIFGSLSSPSLQQATYATFYLQSLTYNNPLPWGYARTEVTTQNGVDKNNNPVNAGKVVYTFSNPNSTTDNLMKEVTVMTVPYSNKPRCAP